MNQLDGLKQYTTVVADTGDFNQLKSYQPQDATTNPSLILKAVQRPEYAELVKSVVSANKGKSVAELSDRLIVRFGQEILNVIPGRVSTEVDARLSFNTAETLERAEQILALYREAGVDTQRVLIKIASTWEGIQAARALEKRGIRTNLTLLFSFAQAVACADAKVQLISPFVGRIYDWYKKNAGAAWDEAANSGVNDPGVKSVKAIFDYYKHFDIRTEIMGASFRNTGQILALAGSDLLTISPDLLQKLADTEGTVEPMLNVAAAKASEQKQVHLDEAAFRYALNEDAMATEKLAEGIRAFAADAVKLETILNNI